MDIRDRLSTRKKYLIDITNFKIIQKISTGGFGTVFMIKNHKNKTKYAAKIINGDTDNEQSRKMINREIGILMRLQHPNIIQFIGYSLKDFKGNDNVTLIMTLAEKGSLAAVLQDVQHGLADPIYDNTIRQKILIGIARGMMYLHKNHVVHRDLKPGNILLNNNYHPLITDFGLSKIYSLDQSHKQTEGYGTSIYMAPEIIQSAPYNGKADVYSFGILMYEVVTDTIPYPLFQSKKMSLFEFNNKIVKENYRPKFNVPIKNSIKKLIEDCWSDDPKLRPTFDEIFNKLAFNMEENIYDIFEDDEENKFYLDDSDVDEILSYAYEIIENETQTDTKISEKELTEMNDQISKQKVLIDSLKKDNDELKRENDNHKKSLESMICLINEQKEMIEALNKENSEQKKINSDMLKRLELLEDKMIQNPSIPPKLQVQPKTQIIEIKKRPSFEGIIHYLTLKTNGNIHDNGTIEVTTNSIGNGKHPRYLLSDDPRSYLAKSGATDFWVCFDFKSIEFEISSYIVKKYNCLDGHLKNWVLEVSSDGINWDVVDERLECSILLNEVFDVKPNVGRFCRIHHKGQFWGYKPNICPGFSQIDFFGRFKIPIIE